jgi:hypothetical protein
LLQLMMMAGAAQTSLCLYHGCMVGHHTTTKKMAMGHQQQRDCTHPIFAYPTQNTCSCCSFFFASSIAAFLFWSAAAAAADAAAAAAAAAAGAAAGAAFGAAAGSGASGSLSGTEILPTSPT